MDNIVSETINTPWKAVNELMMYGVKPYANLYVGVINRVRIGKNSKFYGLPLVYRHRGSSIEIGNDFENRNWWFSNPLGINHPTILCTWSKNASIKIGNDVGLSGGAIVAAEYIEIGDGSIIGANCTIIDTDFHPVNSHSRRYEKDNIKNRPIIIGKNVFVGTGAIILKGAAIPDNAIIPSGFIIRSDTKYMNYNNKLLPD